MTINNYFYDKQQVRYQLVKSMPGNCVFNWLFIPGGAGADSVYFLSLIEHLEMPGNYWLIDLPANGSHLSNDIPADFNFDKWDECFISALKKFKNPIVIGHSFGGMYPLLFPDLEEILKGFVILNSAPSLWLEAAAAFAKQKNLPLLTPMHAFVENPSQDTFKEALLACAPYYFSAAYLAKGIVLLNEMPFNYHAAVWWLKRSNRINFTAQWIPDKVPTLIIGASNDAITPMHLFENDHRFARENIHMQNIENASHFPWLEKPQIVKEAFTNFVERFL